MCVATCPSGFHHVDIGRREKLSMRSLDWEILYEESIRYSLIRGKSPVFVVIFPPDMTPEKLRGSSRPLPRPELKQSTSMRKFWRGSEDRGLMRSRPSQRCSRRGANTAISGFGRNGRALAADSPTIGSLLKRDTIDPYTSRSAARVAATAQRNHDVTRRFVSSRRVGTFWMAGRCIQRPTATHAGSDKGVRRHPRFQISAKWDTLDSGGLHGTTRIPEIHLRRRGSGDRTRGVVGALSCSIQARAGRTDGPNAVADSRTGGGDRRGYGAGESRTGPLAPPILASPSPLASSPLAPLASSLLASSLLLLVIVLWGGSRLRRRSWDA